LSERKQDIPLLAEHFIRQFNVRKERNIQGLSPEALALLMGHPFPGNVRELENIIEYAFITCKGPWIEIQHLPKYLLEERKDLSAHLSERERSEAETIRAMLDRHGDDRQGAARALGMSRTTLWRRMKKYGIPGSTDETGGATVS